MGQYKLKAQKRDITKKKVKNLRKSGFIPAAIFGYNGNFNIQLDSKEFNKIYDEAGNTSVVDIDLDGKTHSVYISEVQMNPVTREWIHASLREIKMNEEITASIPLVLVGAEESSAVKDEKMLIILLVNEIELRGLPRQLPSEITLDVSGFHANDTLTVKDIKLPTGVTFVHEDEEAMNKVIVTTASAVQAEVVEDVQAAIDADAAAKNVEFAGEGSESTGEPKSEKSE